MTNRTLDGNATKMLQGMNVKDLRAKYAAGDKSGAVKSAARYAVRENKTTYVYPGNSYGQFCWRVTFKLDEVTCLNNNTARGGECKYMEVTPAREIFHCEITKD